MANFATAIGMNGVSSDENVRARRYGTYFEAPMLLLAVGVVLLWYLEQYNIISHTTVWYCDLIIWIFFIIETIVLTSLVDDKKRHLRNNWMNILIILVGIAIVFDNNSIAPILRSLRLLLLFALFVNMFSTLQKFLAKNNLGITLVISMTLVIIVGLLITVIDPAIPTFVDGLWWAWVTVTTVGYGDVVPTSNGGRIIGAILILIGFGLFSLLTASISAFMIVSEEEEVIDIENHLMEKLDQISERLNTIENRLNDLQLPDADTSATQGNKDS